MTTTTHRFLYHAAAVPLSGEIRRPFQKTIDAQASGALPRYGGRSAARHDSFRLDTIVAHSGASSELTGVYHESSDTHETTVRSNVEGLDVRGIVTAEVLATSLHSTHPAAPRTKPRISIAGSEIRGLRIAGRDIELESRVDIYAQLDTLGKLRDYYRENAAFRDDFDRAAYVGRADQLPEDVWKFFPWRNRKPSTELPEYHHLTIVPLYTVKNPSEPGFEVYGNVIKIHDFGRVQLGELIVESRRRRLMMLHADLGSPVEGCITCSCGDGNGSSGPPPDDPPPGGDGDDD